MTFSLCTREAYESADGDGHLRFGVAVTTRLPAVCRDWYGHLQREGLTVAGNLLVGEAVIEATADRFERADPDEPMATRLIDALAAGQAEGGDKREELTVQSAALRVHSTEDHDEPPLYNDLRVDASETPVADLRETFDLAYEADRQLRERAENSD